MSQLRSTMYKTSSSNSSTSSNSSVSSPNSINDKVGSLLISPTYSRNYRITLAPPESTSSLSQVLPFSLDHIEAADVKVTAESMPFPLPPLPKIQEEMETDRLNLSKRQQIDDDDDDEVPEPRSRARSDRVDSDTADSSLVGGGSINNEDRLSNAPSGYDLHSEISQAVQRAILSNNNTWQAALRKSEEEWSRSKSEGMAAQEKRLTDLAKREKETWESEKKELTTKLDHQMRFMGEELERARTTAMEERAKTASLNGQIERLKSTMIPIKTHEEKFLASELHFKSKVLELEERIRHARLTQEQSFARAQNVLKMQDERILVQVSIKEAELKDKVTIIENEHREKRDRLLEESKKITAESAEEIKTLRALLDAETKRLIDEQAAFIREHESHLISKKLLEETKLTLATSHSELEHIKSSFEDIKRSLEAERISHENTKEALLLRGQALMSPSVSNREIRSPTSPSRNASSTSSKVLTGEDSIVVPNSMSTLSDEALYKLSLSSIQKKGQAVKVSVPVPTLEALALMADDDGFASGMELPDEMTSRKEELIEKANSQKEYENTRNEIRLLKESIEEYKARVYELETKLKISEDFIKASQGEIKMEKNKSLSLQTELENEKASVLSLQRDAKSEKTILIDVQEELRLMNTTKSALEKELLTLQEAHIELQTSANQSIHLINDISNRLQKSEDISKQLKSQLALSMSALLADQTLSSSDDKHSEALSLSQGVKRFVDLIEPTETNVTLKLQSTNEAESKSRVGSTASFISTFLSSSEGKALANARIPSYASFMEALSSLFSLSKEIDSIEDSKMDLSSTKQPLEASSDALRIVKAILDALETHVEVISQAKLSPTKALSIFSETVNDKNVLTNTTSSSSSFISDRNLLSLDYVGKRYSSLLTILRFGASDSRGVNNSDLKINKSIVEDFQQMSNTANIAARTLLSFLRALSSSGAVGEASLSSSHTEMSALDLLDTALDSYLLSSNNVDTNKTDKNDMISTSNNTTHTHVADKDVTEVLEGLVATVNDMRSSAVKSERRAGEAVANSTLVREAAHVAMLSMQKKISSLEYAIRETNTSVANGISKLSLIETKAKDAETMARDLATRLVRSQSSWNECVVHLRRLILQLEHELSHLAAFEKKRAPHLPTTITSPVAVTLSSPQTQTRFNTAAKLSPSLNTSSLVIKAPTRKPPVVDL
jgi:hypothetical protein